MGQALQVAPDSASKAVAEFRESNCDLQVSGPEKSPFEIVAASRKGQWFPKLARLISRDKPAAAIHHLTGERERTCYDWCHGVDPPSRAVIKLLHSPVGWTVLEYLMRGCKQPWWLDLQRARICAAAYEQARGQLEMSF